MAKVLVVDDDSSILILAQTVLTRAGHNALVTKNPNQVVGLVENEAVDVVVLDVLMPEKDGFEVLTELKARPGTSKVAVLMLSTLSSGPNRVRGLRHGASDYLTKPLEPEELLLKLDRILLKASHEKLSGSLDYLPLDQIMQSLSSGSHRGTLKIEAEHEVGEIRVWNGSLSAAKWRDLSDDEALWAMLGLDNGSFRFRPATTSEEPPETQMMPLSSLIGPPPKSAQPESDLSLPLVPGVVLAPEDRRFLVRVQMVIEDRLDDQTLSVKVLAEQLAVHRSQLYRRLRELTEMSPNQLIVHLRMERAAALLRDGNTGVSMIALAVGFQSFAHFCRRFKERFGQTPSAYQRGSNRRQLPADTRCCRSRWAEVSKQ